MSTETPASKRQCICGNPTKRLPLKALEPGEFPRCGICGGEYGLNRSPMNPVETDKNGIRFRRTGKRVSSGSGAPDPSWREPVVCLTWGPHDVVHKPPFERGGMSISAITEWEVVEVYD